MPGLTVLWPATQLAPSGVSGTAEAVDSAQWTGITHPLQGAGSARGIDAVQWTGITHGLISASIGAGVAAAQFGIIRGLKAAGLAEGIDQAGPMTVLHVQVLVGSSSARAIASAQWTGITHPLHGAGIGEGTAGAKWTGITHGLLATGRAAGSDAAKWTGITHGLISAGLARGDTPGMVISTGGQTLFLVGRGVARGNGRVQWTGILHQLAGRGAAQGAAAGGFIPYVVIRLELWGTFQSTRRLRVLATTVAPGTPLYPEDQSWFPNRGFGP